MPLGPRSDGDLERETVILFVDIIGSSEVSNHKTPRKYMEFVTDFQRLFCEVCRDFTQAHYEGEDLANIQWSTRGDEGLLMIYRPKTQTDAGLDIDLAVNVALGLKRRWLCSRENKHRIESGLLPIDLGIGIHVGRTFLAGKDESPAAEHQRGVSPEGYAINLAKRVESHSRNGKFSRIILSEAAHARMNQLPDERTYLFDTPQTVSPKGISRDIRVYEVKHHFLPSDWKEEATAQEPTVPLPPHLSVKSDDPENLRRALEINPTNLWLAEDLIKCNMLVNFLQLHETLRSEIAELERVFRESREIADNLAQGDQRDAGILLIQGLIEGECSKYNRERELYDEAIRYQPNLSEAYWYKAQSLSYEVWEEIDEEAGLEVSKADLPNDLKTKIDDALSNLKKATRMRSQAAWFFFDYGCELIRWAENDDQIEQGIEQIELAAQRYLGVIDKISAEPYLKKVLENERIRILLSRRVN